MWRSSLVGLLAVAGCNQIWGLDEVDLDDAGDGSGPRVHIQTQIAVTKPDGSPEMMLVTAPLSPAPEVHAGLLEPGAALEPLAYRASDGAVFYPRELVGKPWRLVYSHPDGVPREVQWSPPGASLAVQLVETLLGRAERALVPAGSGYSLTPLNAPASYTNARVFTTGMWTEGVEAGAVAGPKFDYAFPAKAKPLSGDLGAPENARGDLGVLANFRTDGATQCRVSSGVAMFQVPDLAAGTLTSPAITPEYLTVAKVVSVQIAGPTPIHGRITIMLDSLLAGDDEVRWEYGYVPSLDVFGFSKPGRSSFGAFSLPGPGMLALTHCKYAEGNTISATPLYVDDSELGARFSRVVHMEIVNTRTVGAGPLTLRSGFSAVTSSSDDQFRAEFLVAAPLAMRLSRGGTALDLVNGTDGAALPPLGAPGELTELTFQVEPSSALTAHSFEITLHEVAGANLVRRRVYTVTEPKVRLAPADLPPNLEFVLEVRSYRGLPSASEGNFAFHTYPQFAATVFTRTFRTPP